MRTKIIITLLLVAVGTGLAWFSFRRQPPADGFDLTQNSLPPETRSVLDTGQTFILLSLDPTDPLMRSKSAPPPKETFHGYAVLGKTEIREEKQRADLLRALYKGIADSDGSVMACFKPRHGISVTFGDETVDLVICYECRWIETHAKAGRSILTTRSPEKTFNRALETAGLPVAKEK